MQTFKQLKQWGLLVEFSSQIFRICTLRQSNFESMCMVVNVRGKKHDKKVRTFEENG